MRGEIIWKAGEPSEYGEYLILCLDNKGNSQIRRDIWFDDGRGWQSKWHNMIAWCHFKDIKIIN
jgi:hypothetical protein